MSNRTGGLSAGWSSRDGDVGIHQHRYTEVERRAAPRFGLAPNSTTVCFDDLLSDRESKSEATWAMIEIADLIKALEDPSLMLERYPGALVSHPHEQVLLNRADSNPNIRARGRELHRIGDEILENAAKTERVRDHLGWPHADDIESMIW